MSKLLTKNATARPTGVRFSIQVFVECDAIFQAVFLDRVTTDGGTSRHVLRVLNREFVGVVDGHWFFPSLVLVPVSISFPSERPRLVSFS